MARDRRVANVYSPLKRISTFYAPHPAKNKNPFKIFLYQKYSEDFYQVMFALPLTVGAQDVANS